jgi:hypothetical protein
MGFEPTISVLEKAKTVHVLEPAATVIGPAAFHSPETLLSASSTYYLFEAEWIPGPNAAGRIS